MTGFLENRLPSNVWLVLTGRVHRVRSFVAARELQPLGKRAAAQLLRHEFKRQGLAHLYGLPSLGADMYQESVLRSFKASEALGPWWDERCFAPANDPFATANVLKERVEQEETSGRLTNLYLSPIGTKPQVLGFALYFATERRSTASSIIFPFTSGYDQETSQGIARSWLYNVERL